MNIEKGITLRQMGSKIHTLASMRAVLTRGLGQRRCRASPWLTRRRFASSQVGLAASLVRP